MNEVLNFFNSIINKNKKGEPKGVYSICNINKYVLETALLYSSPKNDYLLIESTCNQVNQFGGYSGMTPNKFKEYVLSISSKIGFPKENLIIGGDHIGPFPFKNENPTIAMEKSHELIKSCVQAGYSKIHIDTSIALKGDKIKDNGQIDKELIAKRCVDLVKTAESLINKYNYCNDYAPVYVIGTDIPAPGGSEEVIKGKRVTSVSDFMETMEITKELFYKNKLFEAWERVIAVVIQPGVEHGEHIVIDYDSKATKKLTEILNNNYPNIVFEAHATDYQTAENLKKMVEDKFIILKVGPSLTYALREAAFMLELIEKELFNSKPDVQLSMFQEVLDKAMVDDPLYWKDYYSGNESEIKLSRKYSFFDRSRYYWNNKKVHESFELLIKNLSDSIIPLTLISQFLPVQYEKIRNGELDLNPLSLIRDKIINVIDKYSFAIGRKENIEKENLGREN